MWGLFGCNFSFLFGLVHLTWMEWNGLGGGVDLCLLDFFLSFHLLSILHPTVVLIYWLPFSISIFIAFSFFLPSCLSMDQLELPRLSFIVS